MRTCRTLLTVLISVGLHVSLCTGGIFALATNVADALAYLDMEEAPMSYGAIGYLSCESGKQSDKHISMHIGGCDQRDTCFSQAGSILEDRSIVQSTLSIAAIPPLHHEVTLTAPIILHRYELARAGPLYEQAHSQTHSLIKIE